MSNIREGTPADRNEPIWETSLTKEHLVRAVKRIADELHEQDPTRLFRYVDAVYWFRALVEALEATEGE
jgi:hypothetical protein